MKNILKNLDKTRQHLINEIVELDFNQINFKPDVSQWSIGQVCQHLIITENLFSKAIKLGLAKESEPVELKPIEVILDRNFKKEVPDIAKPTDEQFTSALLIEELERSRKKFLKVLEIEDTTVFSKKSYPHPIFNDLLLIQWVEFLDLHEQRHTDQIRDIKTKIRGQ